MGVQAWQTNMINYTFISIRILITSTDVALSIKLRLLYQNCQGHKLYVCVTIQIKFVYTILHLSFVFFYTYKYIRTMNQIKCPFK